VRFEVSNGAHFLVLSGAGIGEAVPVEGSFIMNDRSQIEAALRSTARARSDTWRRSRRLELTRRKKR
jgi:redox-sensitive bicupin YhaK (pirin superfamily)